MAKSNYFYGYVLCRKRLNDQREYQKIIMKLISQPGRWFGTLFIFPYTGNNHIFQRGWNHQPDMISYHAWQYLEMRFSIATWWLIPLRKWVITPVINGINRINPLITGVITHLLSGMSHQVWIMWWSSGHIPTCDRNKGGVGHGHMVGEGKTTRSGWPDGGHSPKRSPGSASTKIWAFGDRMLFKTLLWNDIPWWIHGAGIYANMTGVYWW